MSEACRNASDAPRNRYSPEYISDENAKSASASILQRVKCGRGEHEKTVEHVLLGSRAYGVVGEESITEPIPIIGFICPHCRCIYVPR